MYMPGRLRTASSPSSTWIALASYAGASARLGASRWGSSGTRLSRSTVGWSTEEPVCGSGWGSCWGIDWGTREGLLVHAHGASALWRSRGAPILPAAAAPQRARRPRVGRVPAREGGQDVRTRGRWTPPTSGGASAAHTAGYGPPAGGGAPRPIGTHRPVPRWSTCCGQTVDNGTSTAPV